MVIKSLNWPTTSLQLGSLYSKSKQARLKSENNMNNLKIMYMELLFQYLCSIFDFPQNIFKAETLIFYTADGY